MADDVKLYDLDFYAWSVQQAGRIRAAAGTHPNLLIDWNEVAEEIEDLGKSLERELYSRLTTIIEHLLKLQFSPALDPREGWQYTVLRERGQIESLLKQSPSLRPKLPTLLPDARREATRVVTRVLKERGEIDRDGARIMAEQMLGEDQVLGDWLPGRLAMPSETLS